MKNYLMLTTLYLLILSCKGPVEEREASATITAIKPKTESQISFPADGLYCSFLDSRGVLWFGSRGGGVFSFSEGQFTHYTEENGLCHGDISCIAEDRAGNLWFGTPEGACRFDGTSFSNLEIPQSDTSSIWLDDVYPVVNPNQVMAILEDSAGRFWIGTNGAGVYLYDGKSFTQYLSDIGMVYDDGQQHNIVLSIVEDLAGHIWFSSLSHGGVSRFDGNTFTHYVEELSDDFIRVVYPDSKGNVWIGTHGNHDGGLDKYDGSHFSAFYKTNDGLSHNNVSWIFEDKTGRLWMGSGTSYLSTFDGNNFEVFRSKDNQAFDQISFIVGDKSGRIWIGNRDGLWMLNDKEAVDMTKNGS